MCVGGAGAGSPSHNIFPFSHVFYNIHRGGENKSVGWCVVQINTVVKT